MKHYVGSALEFPVGTNGKTGMTVEISISDLQQAMNYYEESKDEKLVLLILPLKPENIIPKFKTHSVKLTNIK